MAITVKEAQTLYVSYFGRPADFVGLQYWTGTETLVGSLEQLAHSFYNSAEGKKYFPVDPATNQIDVTASINAIYANMFGRVPETAGFDYWYNEIASGKINLAEAAVAIYKGAQGKDALMIENKIAAATQFTDQVAASNQPSLYYGDQAFAKANEFLNTVTDVTDVTSAGFAAQVNAAVNVAEAAGGASSSEGGIFKLNIDGTPNSDGGTLTNEANVGFTPEGKYLTAGNDVIDLSEWTGSGNVTIGDAFSNDNDKVSVLAAPLSTGSGALKLTAVENLEIISSVPSSVRLNGANFKGLEAIKLIGDATALDVSQLTQGVKIDATANADYITGSNKADTINGGAGNDTINAGSGNDVLTGGNGADTFIVGSVQSLGIDQILDFSAEDKISMAGFTPGELKKFDASTFSTVTYKTLDSVLATFGSGGANATGSGDVVIFSYDGKTYALLANGEFDEANGALVDITGANVASLTESNFGNASLIPTPNPNPNPNPNPTPTPPQFETYATYEAFKADVALGIIAEGQQVGIATMTATEAGDLAANTNYLNKIAAGGIKAITGGSVINVDLSQQNGPHTVNAATFDDKLDPSITVTAINITGSGSADTLGASVFGGTIDGGNGKDTIKLNSGKDVVQISSKDSTAGDNIIGFGVADDILSFKSTVFSGLANLERTGNLTDVSANFTSITTETVNTVYKGSLADLKAKLIGSSSSPNNAGKVVLGVATDAGNEGIYAITLKDGQAATDAFKVVTLTGVDLETLTMDNFALF